MKTINSTRWILIIALTFVLGACDSTGLVETNPASYEVTLLAKPSGLVRTVWPSAADPGLPYYARIQPSSPHILIVDGWAIIPFYRDPECIPPGFNLLQLFDPPTAFGCTLLVEGFSLWHGEPFMGAPKVIHSRGTGSVVFWFIPEDVVMEAVDDGELTMGELSELEGRITGVATQFTEVLHPHANPPEFGGGGHPNPKLVQNARGILDDGRSFNFHVTGVRGEQSITLNIL
jgi:hypothetical protein